MTRMRAIGAAVALSAVLAACGGSSSGKAAGKAGTDGSGAPGAGGSTATSAAGKGSGLPIWDENRKMNDTSGYSSPIAKVMGYDPANQDQAALQAQYKAREQKRQEAIAECMRAQGFEYTPYVQDQSFVNFTPPGYDLTRKEYVEKYGFGISTMVDQQSEQPENMPKPEDDPNFVYMQSLSASDSEAYNKARYGDAVMESPIDESDTGDSAGDGAATTAAVAQEYVPQGCEGEGEKAVNGALAASGDDKAFVDAFNERINKLYESVQADRRVVDATRAYASCMAEKGYPEIDKQEKAYQAVSDKMQPLWEAQGAVFSGDGSEKAVAATVAAVPAGDDGNTPPPTFDPVKLKEVNDYEIGVAKADLACGKDLMKATYEVSQELEQKFVDENGADVERFKKLNGNGLGGFGG